MAALIAIETVVLVLLALLVAGLLRSHATILRQLHELGAGIDDAPSTSSRALTPTPATAGEAADLVGAGIRDDATSLRVRGTDHRTLLAFLSSGCLTCRAFWDAFADGTALGLPNDVRLVVVTKDPADESVSAIRDLAPAHLPLVMTTAAWHDYSVPGSPYFVLADGQTARVVGEGTGMSWPQVLGLLLQSNNDAASLPAALPQDNAARVDAELLAAGIRPGDATLYPEPR